MSARVRTRACAPSVSFTRNPLSRLGSRCLRLFRRRFCVTGLTRRQGETSARGPEENEEVRLRDGLDATGTPVTTVVCDGYF